MRPLLALYFIFALNSLYASEFQFERLSSEDGLSQNMILDIEQDSRGYLWFCTYDGLNRYDGYEFKQFHPSDTSPDSISSNLPSKITNSKDGNFWVATMNAGLNYYDAETNTFETYLEEELTAQTNSHINCLYAEKPGRVWVVDFEKVWIVDRTSPNEATYSSFNIAERIQLDTSIYNMAAIVRLQDGSFITSLNTKLLRLRYDDTAPDGIHIEEIECEPGTLANVRSILLVDHGFIVAHDYGLTLFRGDASKPNSYTPIKLLDQITNDIVFMPDQTLWAAGNHGLFHLKPTENTDAPYQLVHTFKEGRELGQLPTSHIRSLKVDSHGVLWIGTAGRGICKYTPAQAQFRHYYSTPEDGTLTDNRVTVICKDSNENLCIGTKTGLHYLPNSKRGQYNSSLNQIDIGSFVKENRIYTAMEYKDGDHSEFWLSAGFPVAILRAIKTGDSLEIQKHSLQPNASVRTMCQESPDIVWIGTYGQGLIKAVRNGNQWTPTYYNTTNSNIASNIIRSLALDSKKRLWIGSDHGLMILTEEERREAPSNFLRFTHDSNSPESISNDYILPIHISSKDQIWIGTLGGGLNLLLEGAQLEQSRFQHFNTSNGLTSNVINQITEDQSGLLWIGSNRGISRLNPTSQKITNFSLKDGIQDREFAEMAGCIMEDGEIIMGGANGFNVFYSDSIRINDASPPLVFNELTVHNKPMNTGQSVNGQILLKKSINSLEKLVLDHTNNYFSISFSALHYADPASNQYKYMLEGFDKDWVISPPNIRSATYTNLDAGEYLFKVTASNPNGNWMPEPKTLCIVIKPPYWNTLWFKALLLALLATIILIALKIRVMAIQRRQVYLQDAVTRRTQALSDANRELKAKQKEITSKNLEISKQHDEIIQQHEELDTHRAQLEETVKSRTEELRQAKEEAERSEQLKSSFIANMSHEIRTPLNAIIGFSNMIAEDEFGNEEKQEVVDIINQNSSALMRIIDDILHISSIESNTVDFIHEEFSVFHTLEGVLSTNKLEARKKALDLSMDYLIAHDTLIIGDSARFTQIVNNLITNAIKYTPTGSVKIGIRMVDTDLQVSVKDTGIGIDKSEQNFVFGQFTKIEKNTEELFRGVGLGLYISKRLCDLLGFQLSVKSELNKGSTFTLTIPEEKIMSPDGLKKTFSSPHKEQSSPILSGLRILVVDDEPNNFRLMDHFLQSTHATVLHAENGLKAVEAVKADDRIQLVLMDIKMPIMNGTEALHEIRKIKPDLPVIAQTAHAMTNEKETFIRDGFNAHISKPIIKADLLAAISIYLK